MSYIVFRSAATNELHAMYIGQESNETINDLMFRNHGHRIWLRVIADSTENALAQAADHGFNPPLIPQEQLDATAAILAEGTEQAKKNDALMMEIFGPKSEDITH